MGRINAFWVIERLERMDTISGQNTESVKIDKLSIKNHKLNDEPSLSKKIKS